VRSAFSLGTKTVLVLVEEGAKKKPKRE